MEVDTSIYPYGQLWEKREQIKEDFDWNDILAHNMNFYQSPESSNPEVFRVCPEGKEVGSVSARGKKIIFHTGGDWEEIIRILEETLSDYYSASVVITMDRSFPDFCIRVYLNIDDKEEHYGISTGDLIKFGKWPQGAQGEELPITWKVLAINGDEALLLSEKCLMISGYCDREKGYNNLWYLMWGNSLAREMCNGVFYHRISSDLKPFISPQKIDQVNQGPLCKDEVFLLSEGQVRLFMPDKETRFAEPTDYLMSELEKAHHYFYKNENGKIYTPWWILPEERGMIHPKAVVDDGRIYYHGRLGYYDFFTIRPAISIKLSEKLRAIL